MPRAFARSSCRRTLTGITAQATWHPCALAGRALTRTPVADSQKPGATQPAAPTLIRFLLWEKDSIQTYLLCKAGWEFKMGRLRWGPGRCRHPSSCSGAPQPVPGPPAPPGPGPCLLFPGPVFSGDTQHTWGYTCSPTHVWPAPHKSVHSGGRDGLPTRITPHHLTFCGCPEQSGERGNECTSHFSGVWRGERERRGVSCGPGACVRVFLGAAETAGPLPRVSPNTSSPVWPSEARRSVPVVGVGTPVPRCEESSGLLTSLFEAPLPLMGF